MIADGGGSGATELFPNATAEAISQERTPVTRFESMDPPKTDSTSQDQLSKAVDAATRYEQRMQGWYRNSEEGADLIDAAL